MSSSSSSGDKYTMVPDDILFNTDITPESKILWCWLKKKAFFTNNEDNNTFVGDNVSLSMKMSVNEITINRQILELVENGLISVSYVNGVRKIKLQKYKNKEQI